MRARRSRSKITWPMILVAACLAGVAAGQTARTQDSAPDTTRRQDSVAVVVTVPEPARIETRPLAERVIVMAGGIGLLGGFIVLLWLKRREADRMAQPGKSDRT